MLVSRSLLSKSSDYDGCSGSDHPTILFMSCLSYLEQILFNPCFGFPTEFSAEAHRTPRLNRDNAH